MKIFIAAPFGNYLRYSNNKNVISVAGTYTLKFRGGLIKRVLRILLTLRYSFKQGGWINKLGLPNPGIEAGIKKISFDDILSIAEIDSGDFVKLLKIIPKNQSLEINLSCPNINKKGNNEWADAKLFINKKGELNRKYCIAKISPLTTLEELKFLIDVAGFTQIHCCNTLPVSQGGLSGGKLKPYVIKLIKLIRQNWGDSVEIIAGGGISSCEDIQSYVYASADHVSLGTICFMPWKVNNIINNLKNIIPPE